MHALDEAHVLVARQRMHFIATDVQAKEGALAFRLNTDELIVAGPPHPLRATGDADTPAIYLAVRHGCEARLDRSTWTPPAVFSTIGALGQG